MNRNLLLALGGAALLGVVLVRELHEPPPPWGVYDPNQPTEQPATIADNPNFDFASPGDYYANASRT